MKPPPQPQPVIINTPPAPPEPEKAPEDDSSEENEEWYFVQSMQSDSPQGPYTLSHIRTMLRLGQADYHQAFVFRDGDLQRTPVSKIDQLNRRSEKKPKVDMPPPPDSFQENAEEEGWYIADPDKNITGPFSLEEIQALLDDHTIKRTYYAWKSGNESWIHVFEIPGFDRRAAA